MEIVAGHDLEMSLETERGGDVYVRFGPDSSKEPKVVTIERMDAGSPRHVLDLVTYDRETWLRDLPPASYRVTLVDGARSDVKLLDIHADSTHAIAWRDE